MVERAQEGAGPCGDDPAVEEVVVLTFEASPDARRALTALHRLHETGDIRLSAGAVVGRRRDGRAFALEQREAHPAGRNLAHRAAGVADLLRGPFGVVLENAPDALVGSLVDVADLEKSDRLLRCFGVAVPAGGIATVALVTEARPDVIDSVAARFDAVLVRKPREDVEADITADAGPFPGGRAPAEHDRRRQGRLGKFRAAFGRKR